jgi:hypothetical protein
VNEGRLARREVTFFDGVVSGALIYSAAVAPVTRKDHAKAHFCCTIDLIVVSLVTYAFGFWPLFVWFFVAVPLVMRKRIIAFMMNPR